MIGLFQEFILYLERTMDYRKLADSQKTLKDQGNDKSKMGRITLITLLEQAEEIIETRAQHMTFHEYSRERIASQGEVRDTETRLNIAALGLAGETGEFVEMVKKTNFHAWKLDKEKAIKELGDILWYINYAADAIGTSLEEIARKNNEKLRARYPNGFNLEDASKRQDFGSSDYNSIVPEWAGSEDFGGSDYD